MASDFQVRALYDFQSENGTGELTIYADEILTVTRQDVGEGWWEGINSRGESGLFPAEYVESLSAPPPPAMPPPPLPPSFTEPEPIPDPVPYSNQQFSNNTNNADFSNQMSHQAQPTSNTIPTSTNCGSFDDDWDSDWDDDASSTTTADQGHLTGSGNFGLSGPNRDITSNNSSHINAAGKLNDASGKGTVKKSMNRFSTFVKSGGEAFILGQTKLAVKDHDKIEILDNGEEIMWGPNLEPYTCTVTSPKKETKLKGLKSYITYTITSSFNNLAVSRRYKHFDWLHERLEEKFCAIPIPPLPDKQISGRYQDDFIEHRRIQLQHWVNRVARHPVISQSDVWKHFVCCTDEKRWKQGKRRAEKDELVGALFFLGISPPAAPITFEQIDSMDQFSRFANSMDHSVKNLQTVVFDHSKKYSGGFQREFLKIGNAFKVMGESFHLHQNEDSRKLTDSIKHTGETYESIGRMFAEQPKSDLEPMADVLHEYKGMLASYPDIITFHKTSIGKKKEFQKLAEDGKLESDSVSNISRKTDVISYAMLAEITHFQQERVADFKFMMQCYITEQIKFYQNIVEKLHDTLDMYNQ